MYSTLNIMHGHNNIQGVVRFCVAFIAIFAIHFINLVHLHFKVWVRAVLEIFAEIVASNTIWYSAVSRAGKLNEI